jgi:hypothetical protein
VGWYDGIGSDLLMANNFEPQAKSVVDFLAERANRHNSRLTKLEIARLGKVWINPALCNAPYQFQNGYTQVGGNEEPFRYRLFAIDLLNVIGTLGAGTNGAIAFRLLPPFIVNITKNLHFIGTVLDTPTFQSARFDIDAATGDVTVTY